MEEEGQKIRSKRGTWPAISALKTKGATSHGRQAASRDEN